MWRTPIFRWKDLCEEEGYMLEIAYDESFVDQVYSVDLEADTTEYTMPPDILAMGHPILIGASRLLMTAATSLRWFIALIPIRFGWKSETQLEGPDGYKTQLNRIGGIKEDWFISCGMYKETEDGYLFRLGSGGITATRSTADVISRPYRAMANRLLFFNARSQ